MFKPVIRIVAFSIIVVGTFALTLGAILFQAASVTKAASDYTVSVTWPSALTSVVWPPSGLPFHLLFGVAILAGFTGLIFFRAPRAIGVGVLFFQAGTGYLLGGGLGGFFLPTIMGIAKDATGSYGEGLALFAALFGVGAIVLLELGRRWSLRWHTTALEQAGIFCYRERVRGLLGDEAA